MPAPELEDKMTTQIKALTIALALCNLVGLVLYGLAHSTEDISNIIWNYLASGVCKLVTVGLGLPLLLFFLESKFKIVHRAEERLLDQVVKEKEAKEEQKKQAERETREKQWQCIELTEKHWKELHSIVIEVIQLVPDSATRLAPIKTITRLAAVATSWETVLHLWGHRFPKIMQAERNPRRSFSVLLNVLVRATDTVASSTFRQDFSDKDKRQVLADSLDSILNGLQRVAHQTILEILVLGMELEKHSESSQDDRVPQVIRQQLLSSITTLDNWTKQLQAFEAVHEEILPDLEGSAVATFRKKAEEIVNWHIEHPADELDSKLSDQIAEQFNELSMEQRLVVQKLRYSVTYVQKTWGIYRI